MKFHKTIRFKLTFWYSLLFVITNLIFIGTANYIITEHYNDRLPKFLERDLPFEVMMPVNPVPMQEFDFNETLRQTRQNDLAQIRKILVLSFLMLTCLSFGSGYLISGKLLNPLKKINKTAKDINSQNLHKQIEHEDIGDEISELVNNLNAMISRLNVSFALQKQFVENASHELKTPLSIIKINLNMAELEKEKLSEETKNYLQTSIKSADLMNKLIEDLLLLSLADRDVKMEKINVKIVLEEAVNQLKMLALKHNITLDSKINANGDRMINGNKALLTRAFMNIIENAIKYSKEKGDIIVKMDKEKDQAVIKIIDNGIGIPEDKREKVFERFYRVDASRSKKSGGTGLGLAITKRIIELHKGSISLTSELNLGTEVTIKI
ncbi:MAG: HAMP domain-containing sensor histidine kinase [Patescibacteria group bacterium]